MHAPCKKKSHTLNAFMLRAHIVMMHSQSHCLARPEKILCSERDWLGRKTKSVGITLHLPCKYEAVKSLQHQRPFQASGIAQDGRSANKQQQKPCTIQPFQPRLQVVATTGTLRFTTHSTNRTKTLNRMRPMADPTNPFPRSSSTWAMHSPPAF